MPQVATETADFRGDDLTGIQEIVGIEELFHFLESRHQRAELTSYKRRAAQPIAMLAADGTTHSPDFFVKLIGQQIHLADVFGIGQIEKGAKMQLPMADVSKQRSRRLFLSEYLLCPGQKFRQALGGNCDVLNKGQADASILSGDTE